MIPESSDVSSGNDCKLISAVFLVFLTPPKIPELKNVAVWVMVRVGFVFSLWKLMFVINMLRNDRN